VGKLSNTVLPPPGSIPETNVRPARVLVVEDQRHLSRYLQYILERAGYDVSVAFDGEQALAAVESFLPDAVLLDPVLPGISGLDVLRRVRANRKNRGLVVLMLLANSHPYLGVESQKAGANSHFTNPIAPKTLLQKLHDLSVPPRRDPRGTHRHR
jgi:two-component system, OmpR family, phosphate regulon response regulator PhoB